VAEDGLLVRLKYILYSCGIWGGYLHHVGCVLIQNRPKEFAKKSSYPEDSDEESTVGKMPPDSDSE